MRRRGKVSAAAGAPLLLLVLLGGCGGDDEPSPPLSPDPVVAPEGDPGAATGTSTGGEQTMQAVATDDLALTADGGEVVADCRPGICRWDVESGELTVQDGSHLALGRDAAGAADDLVAGVDGDGTVLLVDLDTRETTGELVGLDPAGPTVVAFSDSGALLAAANDAGQVVVWDVVTGEERTSFEVGDPVYGLALDPSEQRLAVVGEAGAAVHDATTGELVDALPGATPGAAVAWSPDGRHVAASGPDSTATVWSAETLEEVASLDSAGLTRLAFAPDSRTLAVTAADDPAVTLWRPSALAGPGSRGPAGREQQPLTGLASPPGSVVFSPDGAAVYAVADPDGVRAWSTRTVETVGTFAPPD
jgi:WD40 repeat protein